MKKWNEIIKMFGRSVGVEITRFSPQNSTGLHLAKVLRENGVDIVFDIGANEGQFAKEIRDFGYTGRVISFEPLTSARKNLNLLAQCDDNWIVHDQCAIGSEDGEIEIHVAGNSVSSSVLPMLELHSSAAVGSAYISSENVPICKLDGIATRYLTESSNLFIKIDTQGYEWQVLDGARETLKRARGVLCELSLVPLYKDQRLWRDIVDKLDEEDFTLWSLQKGFIDPRTGQSLQMDGIFLRR
jgi:FkbM family methyltransferase